MKYVFLIFFHLTNSVNAGPIYMGNQIDGYAITPEEAVIKAKPFLYQSFALRVANPPKSEAEFWEMDYLRTHVLIEGDHYLVVRDLPKKFISQYEKHAVRVHIFNGHVELIK